ncbi:MAG TPA: glutathione S-transferase family protein [Stellaceae bacterium]|nr:glutathione S-transferase family protein [Stellaceae bacterium]
MLKLYDLAGAEPDRRFSPYCWRIKMALAHKGLAVETIPWRFTEKSIITPAGCKGRVPVLVDGERWIDESWTIAEYLDEAYPGAPSLFGDGVGRALTRFYQGWADVVLHGALFPILALDIWRHTAAEDREYFRKSREERLGRTLEAASSDREARLPALRETLLPLRLALRSQKFLGGERPLYADYIVFGAFQWARGISDLRLLLEDDPVAAWRGRMLDLHGGLAAKSKGYPV